MGLTKTVLRRPVTTLMVVLSLIVFGVMSIFSCKMELIPTMNMPMLIVMTTYPGASPDDVNELVTRPIEDETGTLTGVKSVTSMSNENYSLILLEYEYGMDIDDAYNDLKKKTDALQAEFPSEVQAPIIIEMDINETASVSMAVNNDAQGNLYNYVNNVVVPEFEKISSVASVDISGGRAEYVSVELIPEKLTQYRLGMDSIASAIAAADFTFPVGDTEVGNQTLSVTTGVEYATMESLKSIPITMGNGNIIYLEDVANIHTELEEASGIGRYNGRDTITVNITKQQSASEVEVSDAVTRTIDRLMAEDEHLEIVVVNDNSLMIRNSLTSVFQTMLLAIVVAMIIIWLFFGDLKASFIVGTSIPVSIMATMVAMGAMGFSLNVVTLSSLVLGVGMMVDNSIVVLESCFRTTKGKGFREFRQAAISGTGIVLQSIFGSTLTTCVVFLPLATMQGMSGQLFKPLGFTIVFCMVASLISAMTIVPLCYVTYRPYEKDDAPLSAPIARLQKGYRRIMKDVLPRRKQVILTSVALLVGAVLLATQLGMELMPSMDEGTVGINIEVRPGLQVEEIDKVMSQVEDIIANDENVDSYLLAYGSSGISMGTAAGSTLTVYLKDDRALSTEEVINLWRPQMNKIPNCDITLQSTSMMSILSMGSAGFSVSLESTQYDTLKHVSDEIVDKLSARGEVNRVHSSLENAAPLVDIDIDPVKAAAEGLTPVQVAGMVNMMLSGTEATTLEVNGNEVSVMVEYPKDEYAALDQVKGIVIPTMTGSSVALTDIAEISFKDSPQSITRYNKQYQVTITADYTDMVNIKDDEAVDAAEGLLLKEVVETSLQPEVTVATSTLDESIYEELGGLLTATFTATFLVFVVMAAQFESLKFSLMVMTTIPFALVGSFSFLFVADCNFSMPSMLGFLMLVGTVVNNGILYVDTVNQYRNTMDMETALIEAGATRLRPILMTTMTTIVAMIPMCFAWGQAGELMQGLALVNTGGLIASTIMALLMLPAYYSVMSRRKKKTVDVD